MSKVKVEDFEINLLYMMTQTFDLLLRDVERRMARRALVEEGQVVEFRHDKKKQFREYLDSIKDVVARVHRLEDLGEQFSQDIYAESAKNHYKSVPVWQEESNELARLILLYADKSADTDNVNAIFKHLRELKGEDIITDEVLDFFRLKTL